MTDAKLTRRRALAFGGAALAGAVVPSTASGARARAARPSWADREALAARVGETFVLHGDEGAVAVRLKSVRDLAGTTPRGRSLKGRSDAYLLTFKPVSGSPAGQATRVFEHPRLGRTQLFAVAGDTTYTVVVNRSVGLSAANRWSGAAVRMNRRRRRRRRIRR